MPRKKTELSREFPYHLTARTNNREQFPGRAEYIWKTLTGEFYLQCQLHGLLIHSFVLMPNHFHLIATSPNRDINLIMKEALGSFTKIVNAKNHRTGHLFGGRYGWSMIKDPVYYARAHKYVLRNPVRAGLAQNVLEYTYSSYGCLLGERHLPIPVLPPVNSLDRLVPTDPEQLDAWLNDSPAPEEVNATRKALRRKICEYAVIRTSRRKPPTKV